MLSRRELLALSAAAGLLRCATRSEAEPDPAADMGRLDARPGAPSEKGTKGLQRLATGVVYVPDSYDPGRPAPLIVALHGARGGPDGILRVFVPHADRTGAVLLAPESTGQTWDIIERRKLGPDIERIDDLLAPVFRRYSIDPKRVCAGGFSDGASYALTLGLANGDLFTHVIAFSPGFASSKTQVGASRYFISHGTRDQVLPVERCGRYIAGELKRAGLPVEYREFDGTHTVPPQIAAAAVNWFVGA
jgi:phospholipase/carboxylesterase